jgi:RNA polymerase sigma factor (sigma-70 family)
MLNISSSRAPRGFRAVVALRYRGRAIPESSSTSVGPWLVDGHNETALLRRIECAPELGWEEFLQRFAPVIFKVVGRFAHTHDERMDLFVHVAEKLREDRSRRLRAYRVRTGNPCSFISYLTVVTHNLALDSIRSANGRYRPFAKLANLGTVDRLIFEYHIRDQIPLRQVHQLLEKRHGIRLRPADLNRRSATIERSLSSSQRWRLLARRSVNRPLMAIDPTQETIRIDGAVIPIRSGCRNPEAQVGTISAGAALQNALATIDPHKRLVLTLRFKVGLKIRETAAIMNATGSQVEHWTREGAGAIRDRLRSLRIDREDLDTDRLEGIW